MPTFGVSAGVGIWGSGKRFRVQGFGFWGFGVFGVLGFGGSGVEGFFPTFDHPKCVRSILMKVDFDESGSDQSGFDEIGF